MACGPYDRTDALQDGTVRPVGIDLSYLAIQLPTDIFAPMVYEQAFDLAEMSSAVYMTLRTRKDFPFVAIPVFPSRLFRHGFIFVNDQAGIRVPNDLEGKRVGLPTYGHTAAVWIRGILQDEYGVSPESIHWYIGGIDGPPVPDPSDLLPDKELSVHALRKGKTLSQMIESGELDAIIGSRVPSGFGKSHQVRRLFPNYREVERDYYRRTGIFPIMHTIVIKEELYEAHPWIAQSVYEAMVKAKQISFNRMRFSGALHYALPWLFDDLDEIDAIFGGDAWPYGLEANRKTLETLQTYLINQGFIKEALPLEELFSPIAGSEN